MYRKLSQLPFHDHLDCRESSLHLHYGLGCNSDQMFGWCRVIRGNSSSLSLFPTFLFAIELLFSQWVYVKPIFHLTLEGHRKDLGGRWSERELSSSAPSQLSVVFIAIVILHCVGTLIIRSGWLLKGHLKPSTPFLHVPCWGIGAIFELKWKEGSYSCIKTWRTAA